MDTANYEFSRLLDCVLKKAKEMDDTNKVEKPS